ncbi:MAG: ADP-ribosylglycohydrolase family protein [Armatimonadetes bacterium]|nr:ADP-ribosylglycohydrolase family protein [Armatimonadota bacterium]
MNAELFDKAYGSLAGAFIGKLFSRTMGKMTFREREARFGWIKDIPNDKVPVFSRTDYLWIDNLSCKYDETLAITELYVQAYSKRRRRISIEDLRDEWVTAKFPINNWYMMSNNLKEVLMQGMPPRLAGAFACIIAFSTTASIPVGIYNAFDPAAAYHDTIQLASISQKEPALSVAAALSACVAEALRSDASADSLLDTAIRFTPDKEFILWDEARPNNPRQVLDQALSIAGSYDAPQSAYEELDRAVIQDYAANRYRSAFNDFIVPMGLAAAFLKLGKGDFRDSLLGAVNFAAYSYLTASLIGSMSGALGGASAIPPEWLGAAEQLTDGKLRAMAETMLDVLEARFARMEEQVSDLRILQNS